MDMGRIRDLYRHMEWADAVVWREVLAQPTTARDARLLEMLHHIHLVQWAFSRVWNGEELAIRELETFDGLRDVLGWAREYYEQVDGILAGIGPEAAGRTIRLPWAQELVETYGEARPTSLEETLIQVVLHSIHHRGQLNARLRELGCVPPLVDYVVWLWMGRPEPVWEEISSG